jgi:hypothetical protein
MQHALIRLTDALLLLLPVCAGPYRAVAFKFRTFGSPRQAIATWLGIAFVFPISVALALPASAALGTGAVLAASAYVQMMAQWCSTLRRRNPFLPHCWAGRAEPLLVFLLALITGAFSGVGGASFIVAGYVCSTVEWRLRPIRLRLDCWTEEDEVRALAPWRAFTAELRAFSAGLRSSINATAASASSATSFVIRAAALALPGAGLALFRFAALALSGAWLVLKGAWSFLMGRRAPTPALAGAGAAPVIYAAPPQGIGRRVTRFFAGHLLWNFITGVIGVNILTIPLALALWLMGWHIDLPDALKAKLHAIVATVQSWGADKKEDAKEWIHEKSDDVREKAHDLGNRVRGEVHERIDDTRDAMREKGHELRDKARHRIDDAKEDLSDAVSRAKRKALRQLSPF